jgi:hypothetical protein
MTDKEREDMRKELKERFTPGARAMPNSIRGLAALANERIEDAIARGQFKVLRPFQRYSAYPDFLCRTFLAGKRLKEILEPITLSSIRPNTL